MDPVLSEQQAHDLAADAYVYGYPLVLLDVTRQLGTNVPKPEENAAPMNQLGHKRKFPDDTFTTVVSPNADTLYSFAFLDLSKEPMVLSVPEMGKRYYLMEMLDAWTNVFSCPGTRTTGNGKGEFAVTGPRWAGQLPKGVKQIKSPTNTVWLIGRTQTNGKEDYEAVHAIQDKYKLTPLSAFGKAYTPPDSVPVSQGVDLKKPPVEQVAKMDASTFFSRLNALLQDNPPTAADAEAVNRFAAIGVVPGGTFDLKALDAAIVRSLERGAREGLSRIMGEAKKPQGKIVNGWEVMTNVGSYGTDYLWRAVIALVGLGANLPEDAIYPRATRDIDGKPLMGTKGYVVEFDKGQLPPVNAFWSITMYNSEQFFVKNPIQRFAIGDRDKLKMNDDGSLTIYVQNESPGKDKESNWLPAPTDSFNLFMRLYWPKEEIVEGTWKMPTVKRIA
jgi:hypothetical protein